MPQIHPDIVRAKESVEQDLLKIPGVTGVDVGFKEKGGKRTNTIAIRVLVEKKKKNVPDAERIPTEIDGHPTDVIERRFELHQVRARKRVEELVPEVDKTKYTPLQGGISIGPCRAVGGFVYVGTLGAIVHDNVTGKPFMLSNFHVMCIDNGFHIGDTQAQPGLVDGGSCPADVVGALQRESLGGSVDCAVADISGTRGVSCEIVDIGTVAGTNTAVLGDPVRKRGRTTGLTYGTVDSIALTVKIDYGAGIGEITLTNQIGVKPDTTHNPKFGDHGDSGSVVVNNGREVVGLYFAGDPTGYGVANPIADVLTALNVAMCTEGGQKPKEEKEGKEGKEGKEDKEGKENKENPKIEKLEKREKPEKPEKPEKLEKNEKREKPEKPEKIEKREKPEKPEKLEKREKREIKEGKEHPKIEKLEKREIKEGKEHPKLEKIEKREIKEGKIEKREDKDHKFEKPEIKDKPEKGEIKEIKEKEHKEDKREIKEKEHKPEKSEIKEKLEKLEIKESSKLEHGEKGTGPKEKDGKELKEGGFEGPGGPGGPGDPGPFGASGVEERLAALEQAVAQLTHFITAAQRPDLSYGALTGEEDLAAKSAALGEQAGTAKGLKDLSDR